MFSAYKFQITNNCKIFLNKNSWAWTFLANQYENANYCWHFHILLAEKLSCSAELAQKCFITLEPDKQFSKRMVFTGIVSILPPKKLIWEIFTNKKKEQTRLPGSGRSPLPHVESQITQESKGRSCPSWSQCIVSSSWVCGWSSMKIFLRLMIYNWDTKCNQTIDKQTENPTITNVPYFANSVG